MQYRSDLDNYYRNEERKAAYFRIANDNDFFNRILNTGITNQLSMLVSNCYDSFIDKYEMLGIKPEEFTGVVTLELYYDGDDVVINMIDNGKTVQLESDGMPAIRVRDHYGRHFGGKGQSAIDAKHYFKDECGGSIQWHPLEDGTRTEIRIPNNRIHKDIKLKDNDYIVLTKNEVTEAWDKETVRSHGQGIAASGKASRNRWAFVDVSYLIGQMLTLSREHKIEHPKDILIPLIKKHIRNRNGEAEILLEGYDIDGIEEVRDGTEVTEFTLPVKRDGKVVWLAYSLKGGDVSIPLGNGTDLYVTSKETRPVSYVWHNLFRQNAIPMDGTIVEVAPGYETKIGDALGLLGFHGTIILIEPDEAAAAHILQAYKMLMPRATVKVVVKLLQDVEIGRDIPSRVDALTANHPFDDMAIAFAMGKAPSSIFTMEKEDGWCLKPAVKHLYDAISDEDYIRGVLSTTALWIDFMQKLKPAYFIASQYPGHTLARKGLTKRQNSGLIAMELLRGYYRKYLKEDYEDKIFEYKGGPAYWVIARKPFADLEHDLAEPPAAMQRLGKSVFVRQQARRLDPAEYDVTYTDDTFFDRAGYGGGVREQARAFAIAIDNNGAVSPKTVETYADRQKDRTEIALGGNIGSGRAVYYGNRFNVMGPGRTTLNTSTIPSHSTGRMDLVGALRRVLLSRWINYFTKRATAHPVVIALKETARFNWCANPIPLALLVRVDDGTLDRPSHVEFSPDIAVDFERCLAEYAQLDAEYFAYRMMLGAWSTGNYSLRGDMIDLETASFVKYRGPYTTASKKYREDFFGYEGSGLVKILKQLAETKGITGIDIERRFQEERQRFLARAFLSLLGLDETRIPDIMAQHEKEIIALSGQFETLAKKISPKKADLNLYEHVADKDDPTLLDMSNLFRNLALLYGSSSDREGEALKYLVRTTALEQVKPGILYEPGTTRKGEVNQGEVFLRDNAVVTYDRLEDFLGQTRAFTRGLFQLLDALHAKNYLPEKPYWADRLQFMNQEFPTLYELDDKLKYWVEEYRLGRVDAKTLGLEVEKLCQLPYYPTSKSYDPKDVPLFNYLKLNEDELRRIAPYLTTVSYKAGETIVRQGDEADSLYIMVQGACKVVVGGKELNTISNRGMLIGEAAALTPGSRRAATIIAETPATLLQIHRDGLEAIMAVRPELGRVLARILQHKKENLDTKVLGLKLFEGIDPEEIRLFLAEKASTIKIGEDQEFIKQDEKSAGVYLLLDGSVALNQAGTSPNAKPIRLNDIPLTGGMFGELSVIGDQGAVCSVVANDDVTALFISRDDFKELLSRQPRLLRNCLDRIKDYSEANKQRGLMIARLKESLSSPELADRMGALIKEGGVTPGGESPDRTATIQKSTIQNLAYLKHDIINALTAFQWGFEFYKRNNYVTPRLQELSIFSEEISRVLAEIPQLEKQPDRLEGFIAKLKVIIERARTELDYANVKATFDEVYQHVSDKHKTPEVKETFVDTMITVFLYARNVLSDSLPDFREEPKAVNLNAVLDSARSIDAGIMKSSKREYTAGNIEIVTDEAALTRALVNIMLNASDAIHDHKGGDFLIRTSLTGDKKNVEIALSDTAGGISAELLPHIFERNVSSKWWERPSERGLGLAIVKEYIEERCGGTISVESEPGKGTTFTVRLPAKLASPGLETRGLPAKLASPDERIHATNFRDTVHYVQAQPQAQPFVIALGTNWMTGYKEGGLYHDALNPLMTSLQNCGIPFVIGPDEDLPALIEKEKERRGLAADTKVIALAGASKDKELPEALKELLKNRANTVVGVDSQELTVDSYIRLMEMLTAALKLSIGIEPALNNGHIAILPPNATRPIYIFVPHAEPMDYERLKEIYEVQRFA